VLLGHIYRVYFLVHIDTGSFEFDSDVVKGVLHVFHLSVDDLLELTELPRIRLAVVHCRYSTHIRLRTHLESRVRSRLKLHHQVPLLLNVKRLLQPSFLLQPLPFIVSQGRGALC